MFCAFCGKQLEEEAQFCSQCGKRTKKESVPSENRRSLKNSRRWTDQEWAEAFDEKPTDKALPEEKESITLATNCCNSGDNAGAIKIYRMMLENICDRPKIQAYLYIMIAVCYSDLDEYESAEKTISEALSLGIEGPTETYAMHIRGLCRYNLEKHEDALKDFEMTIKLAPENSVDYLEARSFRGMILLIKHRLKQAFEDFDYVLKHGFEDGDSYYGRGECYRAKKNYPLALEDYSKALPLIDDPNTIYFNWGEILYEQKKYQEAIEMNTTLINNCPTDCEGFYNRGLAEKCLKMHEAAVKDFDEAIRLGINNNWAFYNKGNSLKALYRYEEAAAEYAKFLDREPDGSSGYKFVEKEMVKLKSKL